MIPSAHRTESRDSAEDNSGPFAETFQAPDGARLTVWRWPQKPGRSHLHFAHATGFHARTYAPLLRHVSEFANVSAWDMRGHGQSADAGRIDQFSGWQRYYDDLTAWLDEQPGPVFLAGHSVGATTSTFAAAARPEKVAGLILLDPVFLSARERWLIGINKRLGYPGQHPMAVGAARRRPEFPDRQAAFDNYHGRGAFRTWPDEWLRAYVNHGFVDQTDGSVRLACAPAWESRSFAYTEHRPFQAVKQTRCPILLLGAEIASTCPLGSRKQVQRLRPNAKLRELPGSTHFLPMEFTDIVARSILDFIDDCIRNEHS